MTTEPSRMILEDDVPQLIARFDGLERDYTARYGPTSQARVFVLMEQLVTLRFAALEASPGGAGLLQDQRRDVVARIQGLYDRSPFPEGPPPPVRILDGHPPIIEFDRAAYTEKYASAAESIRQDIAFLEEWEPEPQTRPTAYMYVVDDTGRLRVWTRAFRMADLILGRNRATVSGVPVAHPMLVPERLRVRAAGEITPIISGGITGVVANLKSGHFRPAPAAAAAVRDACARALGLDPSACDVLTVPAVPVALTPPMPSVPARTPAAGRHTSTGDHA
ncbi:hypothetical protein [Streptomyces sp. A1136]|uniref:hypothetical protein n=1 Tax=Streptomyces sp. A1136 TaxID=2563102 RepID=UPI00113E5BCD|nr:hypothetical protein [Streptomyces sp. A1136]THA48378.1 hypothetical protein E6R62_29465 [Streptomyces sp. A1136]